MKVYEYQDFERGKDPHEALRIGLRGRIDAAVSDPDDVDDYIDEIDSELNTVMQIYLPAEKREQMVRMWLENEFTGQEIWEFKHLDRADDADEEDIDYDDRNDPIDYEVADLEAEGWEVLHTEKNFGVAQSILFRRK